MAGDTPVTVIGNLVADPELRFTPSRAAVANFTVASTPRSFDKNTNEWKDGETLFLRCSVWRDAAENVAESLVRGTRVIVSGRLKSRSYETKEGEKRTVVELEVDEVGPSLRYASAKVTKTERTQQPQQGGGWSQQGGQQAADPWATGAGQQQPQGQQQPVQQGWGGAPPNQGRQQGGGWGAQPPYDEPPFAFPPNVP